MNLNEALRQTGEDTSRLSERLLTKADKREDTARELLEASAAHIKCLEEAGMYAIGLATGVLTLLTVILAKVNPEKIPDTYTAYIQDLYLLSIRVCRIPDDNASVRHYLEINMRLGVLALVTFRALCSGTNQDNTIAKRNALFEKMFASVPAEFYIFQNKKITPQSAIDILSDAASRLASLGIMD